LNGTLFVSFLSHQPINPVSPIRAIDEISAVRALILLLLEEELIADEDCSEYLVSAGRFLNWNAEDDDDDDDDDDYDDIDGINEEGIKNLVGPQRAKNRIEGEAQVMDAATASPDGKDDRGELGQTKDTGLVEHGFLDNQSESPKLDDRHDNDASKKLTTTNGDDQLQRPAARDANESINQPEEASTKKSDLPGETAASSDIERHEASADGIKQSKPTEATKELFGKHPDEHESEQKVWGEQADSSVEAENTGTKRNEAGMIEEQNGINEDVAMEEGPSKVYQMVSEGFGAQTVDTFRKDAPSRGDETDSGAAKILSAQLDSTRPLTRSNDRKRVFEKSSQASHKRPQQRQGSMDGH
jgi:hypothetical protein